MAKKNDVDVRGFWLKPMALVQGLLVITLLVILISIVLALIVHFSTWTATPRILNLLVHLGVFAGAVFAGLKCGEKAWLHGIVVGFLAFFLLSLIGYDEPLFVSWLWWKSLLRMGVVSMLGGIVGGLFNN